MQQTRPRALIITALSLEYRAVKEVFALEDPVEYTHEAGDVYEKGFYRCDDPLGWEILLVEAGPGNASAAASAERAISYFRPEVAFFIGIAGGLKDVNVGDVVAATKVYGYEGGKQIDSFFARPEAFRSSHELEQRARAVARKSSWHKRLNSKPGDPAPSAFVGPIAAGEKVLATDTGDLLKMIRTNYNDALAIEMEGRGFHQSAQATQNVKAMVVRGISDLCFNKEQAEAKGSQLLAARNAAAFAATVLAELSFSKPVKSLPEIIVHGGEIVTEEVVRFERYRTALNFADLLARHYASELERPSITVRSIVVAATYSWDFVTESVLSILLKNAKCRAEVKLMLVHPDALLNCGKSQKGNAWHEASQNKQSRKTEFLEHVKKLSAVHENLQERLDFSLKFFYNLPHWHGLLLSASDGNDTKDFPERVPKGEHLFLGRTNWDWTEGSPNLRVGENMYRYYDATGHGNERIEMFKNWFRYYDGISVTDTSSRPTAVQPPRGQPAGRGRERT